MMNIGYAIKDQAIIYQGEVRILLNLIEQLPCCHREVLLIVDVHG